MSSAIAIWAATIATADAIVRIIATRSGTASPGRALRTTGEIAASSGGTEAAATGRPRQVCAYVDGTASAGTTTQ